MSEIIQTIIWPVTIIITILLLRKPIANLLQSAKRVKFKDVEVEFQKDIEKLKNELDTCLPIHSTHENNIKVDLFELSSVSPNAAVIEAWKTVETTARKLLTYHGYHVDGNQTSPYKYIQKLLIEEEIVEKKYGKIFSDLRTLRNKIAHAPDFTISTDEANQYVELATKLRNYLNLMIPTKKVGKKSVVVEN